MNNKKINIELIHKINNQTNNDYLIIVSPNRLIKISKLNK